ncbi:MAG: thioredoxin family protein [Magnetovibrio sp.]|nr:thioredoxin family protein [Magnetovibrio sp.]
MMRSIIRRVSAVLFVCAVSVLPYQVEAADFIIEPMDYNVPQEVEAAADEGKNVVIMFGQNGCPYCAKMHKRVFPHPKVAAQFDETFVLFEVNIKGDLDVVTHKGEAKTEKAYGSEMRVRATPLFVFFGKDGSEALRLTGYQDPAMFMTAGRYISSEAYKEGSFLKFVRSGK